MRFIRISGLAATFVLGAAASAPAAPSPLRFEQNAKVARIGGFDVSPDGRWVAYAVGTPFVAENTTRSAIWIAPARGGTKWSLAR